MPKAGNAFGVLAVISGAMAMGAVSQPSDDVEPQALHPVIITLPDPNPTVDSGMTTFAGERVGVSCVTCHTLLVDDPRVYVVEDLDVFHQGLVLDHGDLSCASCHDLDSGQHLRLADGSGVGFDESMRQCAQCHGPQHRDYQSGSHGGMMGHWDLSRGPRERRHCIDCHDPHAPAQPQVLPVFSPGDRFLSEETSSAPDEDVAHE